MNLSLAEFSVFKMSAHPDLRAKHFNLYSNSCQTNATKILEMAKLRRDLAIAAKQKDYFTMKMKSMTFDIARDSGEFLQKIDFIRKAIRPLAVRDICILKKLTGLNDIGYEDIVFLKRAIREVILSKDPNNI